MAKKAQVPVPEAAAEQPYYLQRAHIKDFRSIHDAEVEFKPGLNIIIGPNGSGKTNFIECIPDIQDNRAQSDGNYSFIFSSNISIEINSSSSNQYQSDSVLFNTASDYKKTFAVSAQHTIKTDTSVRNAFLALRDELKLSNHYFKSIKLEYSIPSSYFLINSPVDFTSRQRSFGWSNPGSDAFGKYVVNSFANHFLFRELDTKQTNSESETQLYSIVRKIQHNILMMLESSLQKYTPIRSIRFSPSLFIYYNSIQHEYILKNVLFDFKINKDWLPFSALSSGTQRLFYIISNALTIRESYPENINPANEIVDKIILLEEPELGIHPDQLHLLLQFLREQSKEHQLIITTHSPQVLDMLEEDELDRITICELHKAKGTQFRKLKKTQIETAQRFMREKGLFLSDYWRYGSLEKPSKSAR